MGASLSVLATSALWLVFVSCAARGLQMASPVGCLPGDSCCMRSWVTENKGEGSEEELLGEGKLSFEAHSFGGGAAGCLV